MTQRALVALALVILQTSCKTPNILETCIQNQEVSLQFRGGFNYIPLQNKGHTIKFNAYLTASYITIENTSDTDILFYYQLMTPSDYKYCIGYAFETNKIPHNGRSHFYIFPKESPFWDLVLYIWPDNSNRNAFYDDYMQLSIRYAAPGVCDDFKDFNRLYY